MASELSKLHSDIFPDRWDPEIAELQLSQSNIMCFAAQCLKAPILVGYINVQFVEDIAEILSIGVRADYRHLGIARALMNNCLCKLTQADMAEIFLEVAVSNQIALQLYRKFGFEGVGYRKNYYKIKVREQKNMREDALIMRKPCK